jgi:hypothetical protein
MGGSDGCTEPIVLQDEGEVDSDTKREILSLVSLSFAIARANLKNNESLRSCTIFYCYDNERTEMIQMIRIPRMVNRIFVEILTEPDQNLQLRGARRRREPPPMRLNRLTIVRGSSKKFY